MTGMSGFCAAGAAVAEVDHPLLPMPLAARTCTWYAVPLVRLPTVAVVLAPGSAPPVRVVQLPEALQPVLLVQ